MTKKKFVDVNGRSYGILGQNIPHSWSKMGTFYALHIGDLVSFKVKDHKRSGIVVRVNGEYGVMGSIGRNFVEMQDLQVVVRWGLITEDISKELHNLEIHTPKQMTLEDIERELGYEVELVEG